MLVDSPDDVSTVCDEKYVATGSSSGFIIGIKKASGTKCGRCWFYDNEVGKSSDLQFGDVCQRCNEAISSWEESTGEQFILEETVPENQPVP